MRLTGFLEAFFPSVNEPIFIFGYSPKELPEQLKEVPFKIKTTRAELAESQLLQAKLKRLNETRGLYFTVNSGGTRKEEINRVNACFCEIDDLPLIEQHELFDDCDLPPSIRIETKKSVHAYWLLHNSITIGDFISIQRGLINYFHSDKAIKNQNRVMRLPFFNHVSFELGEYLYKSVSIHTFHQTRYLCEELKGYFSAPVEPTCTPVHFEKTVGDEWQEIFNELRSRLRALPSYHREHGANLASAQGICHNGETNRTLVENLETGKIFCRNECTFDEILNAFGLSRPKKAVDKVIIPRVKAPQQTVMVKKNKRQNSALFLHF